MFEKEWKIFKGSFTVDTSEEPIYLFTRTHMGNMFGGIMAVYNLYLLRQKVIKNAIHVTKSTNSAVVKGMSLVVGVLYFMGLYVMWQIPPFFCEVAVRVYCATEDTVTTSMIKSHLHQQLWTEKNVQVVLDSELKI